MVENANVLDSIEDYFETTDEDAESESGASETSDESMIDVQDHVE